MKLMLDTNICVALIKSKPAQILRQLLPHRVGDVGISWVTLAELEFGVANSQQVEKNRAALDEFILPLEIAYPNDNTARAYGHLRAYLQKKGTPIGSLDTIIGAHALALGVTLVTNKVREFSRVPGLPVIDWLAEKKR